MASIWFRFSLMLMTSGCSGGQDIVEEARRTIMTELPGVLWIDVKNDVQKGLTSRCNISRQEVCS